MTHRACLIVAFLLGCLASLATTPHPDPVPPVVTVTSDAGVPDAEIEADWKAHADSERKDWAL